MGFCIGFGLAALERSKSPDFEFGKGNADVGPLLFDRLAPRVARVFRFSLFFLPPFAMGWSAYEFEDEVIEDPDQGLIL